MTWRKFQRYLPWILGGAVAVLLIIPGGIGLFAAAAKNRVSQTPENKKALADAYADSKKAAQV